MLCEKEILQHDKIHVSGFNCRTSGKNLNNASRSTILNICKQQTHLYFTMSSRSIITASTAIAAHGKHLYTKKKEIMYKVVQI
jgi:hypothetical protein